MKRKVLISFSILLILANLAACGGQKEDITQTRAVDAPAFEIIFTAEKNSIQQGDCTVLRWEVVGGLGVGLNGEDVPLSGEREVCPRMPRSYELVVDVGTHLETRTLEISLREGEAREEDNQSEPVPTASGQDPNLQDAPTPGIPAYQSDSWIRLGGPPGGLGYDIRMHPTNPDVMYVTASPGGIFKSADGGKTWEAHNQGIEPFPGAGANIFCVTVNPHNPDHVWVGTQFSGHVFRSTDGGQSWKRRDNGIPEMVGENSIRGITFDPNNPDVVYVGMERGTGLGGVTGEVYKSIDGGENFFMIWQGDNLARYIWVDPRDSLRLFVSTGFFDRQAANAAPEDLICGGEGILRSADGGQTWTVLNQENGLGGVYLPSIYMHPKNQDILLAAVHQMLGYCPDTVPGVYVTRDGGDSWQPVIDPSFHNVEIAFEHVFPDVAFEAVEISETNPDIWYAAGREIFYRSEDAGQTWKAFPLGTSQRKSGFPVDIQADPRDPYRVFVNNYNGGNFISTDGGETWADASSGYSGAKVDGLGISPGSGGRIVIAGAEASTFISRNGGSNWTGTGIFSPAAAVIQGENGSLIASSGPELTPDGYVYLSYDGGATWESAHVVTYPVPGLYYASGLAVGHEDPQTLYIGFSDKACLTGEWVLCTKDEKSPLPGFHRSQDGGRTWEHTGAGVFSGASIIDIAVSDLDTEIVYATTNQGLYHSTDGGNTWQHLESLELAAGWGSAGPDAPIPPSYVIAIDPFDPQYIYVGSAHNGVWISQDGGETWEAASAGMDPNERINDLLADPAHPGVYVSTDFAATWQKINQGLDFRAITRLTLSEDGSVLYAGSRGAGVFRLGTPAAP